MIQMLHLSSLCIFVLSRQTFPKRNLEYDTIQNMIFAIFDLSSLKRYYVLYVDPPFFLFYWTLRWFSVVKYTPTKIGYVRGSCPQVFYRKGVLKNFANFIRKHLGRTLFSHKVAGWVLEVYKFIQKSLQ